MKIKHRAAVVAAVAISALALTACSGQGGSSSSDNGKVEGTLTGLFDATFKAPIEKIVAAFEKKYPGVKVNFNYQGGDIGSLTLTQLQGGTAPDVLTTFPGGVAGDSSDSVLALASEKRILPITADWTKDIPKVWAPGVTYKDKVYAYPGALQPLSAIYNQDELDKLGLKAPTTVDEVYKLCTDAKSKGVYAYSQGLGDTAAGPQMLALGQMSTLLYGTDPTWDLGLASGKVKYTSSKWVDQFKIYQKMYDNGCFGDGSLGRTRQQGAEAVAAGQALGLVDVGGVMPSLKAANPSGHFVVESIPATNSTTYVTALPGYQISVNAKAKNTAAAQAFVEFMGTTEANSAWAAGFSSVPVIPDASYKPADELAPFVKLVNDGKFAPLAATSNESQVALNKGIQSMLLGNATPQQVAEQMQTGVVKQ